LLAFSQSCSRSKFCGASCLQSWQLNDQVRRGEIQDLETGEGLLYFTPDGQLLLHDDYHSHPRSRLLLERYMEVLSPDGQVLFRNERLRTMDLGNRPAPHEGVAGYEATKQRLDDGTQVLAISHLHNNAVKCSPPGSTIRVRMKQSEPAPTGATLVGVAIEDEGPGIPEDNAERVFDRFYRVDEGRTRDAGGAGLGLAIAKWAVEAHGGETALEPRTPYRGDFHIPEAAALAAVQKSKILLKENKPAEALVAAKKAVALQPENLLAQMATGNAQAALGDKDKARAAYELALAAAHRLEADAQLMFVPDLERKLHL
jgi:tetratricopeptide (TPR) repeat protein